ncbi:MAG: GTPase HflX [Pseudomonadales bacterium]|nr:GTPase HflX [Pseudomonadales bacterium]
MFFERPQSGEKAVLVHLELSDEEEQEDIFEFQELAKSAGAFAVNLLSAKLAHPNAKYFVGAGKVDEIRESARAHDAELVLFNHGLTPSQERNLERELKCRVLDRTGLILDIFAQRARTHEGKLQVELAQLQYMSTRLIRGWTHLERQKGGIGLRGPGETQLETDRRLLRARIKSIGHKLEKVRRQRNQGRQARKRAEVSTASIVGYTNAGKSTLFNCMTSANVYAKDQLFATLDPTFRRIEIDGIGAVILADTVGFIRHLPHKLVEAFQATLQETSEATLLLHVVDAADENREKNIEQVNFVLSEIQAEEVPRLLVYNKIDRLENVKPRIDRDESGRPWRVWLSAQTGEGIDLLAQALTENLAANLVSQEVQISANNGRLRAEFYRQGAVIGESVNEQGEYLIQVRLPKQDLDRILARN